jgi:ABC-2 family transporter
MLFCPLVKLSARARHHRESPFASEFCDAETLRNPGDVSKSQNLQLLRHMALGHTTAASRVQMALRDTTVGSGPDYGIALHRVIRGALLLCLRIDRMRRPSESEVSHLGNPGSRTDPTRGSPRGSAPAARVSWERDDNLMATTTTPSSVPHIQIRSDAGRAPIELREILRHRDLLLTLADRDVKVRYKQTVLGVAWVVLQPLLGSLIFAFVFGVVAHLPSNGRPYILFAFAGLMAWNTFSSAITRASFSLVSNAHMVSKVYFPRLILPLASVASTLIDFGASLGLMLVLLALYRVWPGLGLLLPVWLAILLLMALGIGLLAAALMVKYRDISGQVPPHPDHFCATTSRSVRCNLD